MTVPSIPIGFVSKLDKFVRMASISIRGRAFAKMSAPTLPTLLQSDLLIGDTYLHYSELPQVNSYFVGQLVLHITVN